MTENSGPNKQLKQQLLQQRSETLEKTYEAVHNGPLQELAILLRADANGGLGEPLRSQLEKINQDQRGIYQSMRLAIQDEALYLESGLSLNLDLPLATLHHQVFDHTLARDFPGYDSLQFQITPDFSPLSTAVLTVELKRGLCLFLQEALCNVGKHAIGITRLTVTCERQEERQKEHQKESQKQIYCLRITDNGETPSVIASLLQSLTESPENDRLEKHQGTRQAQALAQQLKGKFLRRQNTPKGTICEIFWPCEPPSVERLDQRLD